MSFILEASGAIGGVGARKQQIEVCFEKRNGIRRRRSRKTRCMYAVSKSCPLSATQGLQPPRLFCPWDSPGKNTRVGCHFLLQGISLTQGSNLRLRCLLHCRRILYLLSHGEAAGQTLGWDIIPPQKRSLKRRLRILHLTCRHFHSGIESFSVSVT